MISDEVFRNTVMSSNTITDTSKQSYLKHLRQVKLLASSIGATLYSILTKPREVLDLYTKLVANKSISLATAKANITALGSLPKRLREARIDSKAVVDVEAEWVKNIRSLSKVLQDKVEENTLSEREKEAWVSYPEWIAMESKLSRESNGSPSQLLVAFHCLISPPRGGDLASVRFVERDEGGEENTIVWTNALQPSYLLIRDHKTDNNIPLIRQELPDKLKESIQRSLHDNPREYLFLSATFEPYTRDAFSRWKNREFQRLFNKPATTNIARHAYITYFMEHPRSINEERDEAQRMGHSLQTHHEYKKLLR
jgi:hypothetical protein